MKEIKRLLINKIGVTALGLCVPLIFFPQSFFADFNVSADAMLFVRLLGIAYAALCVGYYGGLQLLENRSALQYVIYMGLVSNGFAGLVFLFYGVTGRWASYEIGLQIYLWLLVVGAFYMTLRLFYLGRKNEITTYS